MVTILSLCTVHKLQYEYNIYLRLLQIYSSIVIYTQARHEFGVFEMKILRRIYEPVRDGEIWRIRKNRALRDLYGEAEIVDVYKRQPPF